MITIFNLIFAVLFGFTFGAVSAVIEYSFFRK